VLGVVGRFAAYFAAFDLAILIAYATGVLNAMLLTTASISTRFVTLIGITATRSGTRILLPSRVLSVDLACTAVFIVALYAALVLAYPVSARNRLLGIAVGVPIILFTNIVRIVAAAEVSETAPSAFQFFHDYMFQVGMVLVTVAIWVAWLSFTRRDAR
jgi:exosortase/archaeosortase family protein